MLRNSVGFVGFLIRIAAQFSDLRKLVNNLLNLLEIILPPIDVGVHVGNKLPWRCCKHLIVGNILPSFVVPDKVLVETSDPDFFGSKGSGCQIVVPNVFSDGFFCVIFVESIELLHKELRHFWSVSV